MTLTKKLMYTTLLSAAIAMPLWAADWTMYQGNASHTGYVPLDLSVPYGRLAWKATSPSSQTLGLSGQPAVAGQQVFVSSRSQLTSYSLGNGALQWTADMGNPHSATPPSFDNGKVYVKTINHSGDTYLRAYSAVDGSLTFRVAQPAQWESYYAPTIYDGKVYVPSGGYGGVAAIDPAAAKESWFSGLYWEDNWTPAVNANFVFSYLGGTMTALDRITGKSAFTIADKDYNWTGYNAKHAPVLGGNNDLFATNNNRLIKFDLNAKSIAWTQPGDGQPAVAKGIVYHRSSGALAARAETDGALLWMWEAPAGEALGTQFIVTDTHALVASGSKTYAINLTTHKADWSYPAAGPMALTDSMLVIAANDGALYGIAKGALDDLPDPINFASVTGAAPSTGIISTAQTVTGINAAVPISITGGQYSINGGAFTSNAGFVNSGDSLRVNVVASASAGTVATATLNIGSGRASFSVTTKTAAPLPASFTPGITGADINKSLSVAVDPGLLTGQNGQMFLVAQLKGLWLANNGNGWFFWGGGDVPAYSSGVLAPKTVQIFANIDVSNLHGLQVFAGVGTSASDMLQNKRYAVIYQHD